VGPDMIQNTKKTVISRNRWTTIIEFIDSNEATIKTMLAGAIRPEMIRADILLNNVAEGKPQLSARIAMPDGGNSIFVCSLLRPKWFFPNMLCREIQDLAIEDMLIIMSNQVEVV
jgi:hypothetical protein